MCRLISNVLESSVHFCPILMCCICVREDLIQVLPLLTERQYVSAVHSRLMDSQPWKLPGLQALFRLEWALSLRVLSQLPQGLGKIKVHMCK